MEFANESKFNEEFVEYLDDQFFILLQLRSNRLMKQTNNNQLKNKELETIPIIIP